MDHQAALLDYLSLASDIVKKNTDIVSSEETPSPFLVHITGEKTPTYIPRISLRAAHSEDRTMPRVTAATTIFGCILGYATLLRDFMEQGVSDSKGKIKDWKGGLYIRKIPFDVCLKPNKKLVFDAEASNEHWLVPYTPDRTEYESSLLGKMILDSVTVRLIKPEHMEYSYSMFLEVNDSVFFTKEQKLEKGYYHIVFAETKQSTWLKKDAVISAITKDMYQTRKAEIASNLAIEEGKKEAVLNW